MLDLISSKKVNSSIYLPNNVIVSKEYNKLIFNNNVYLDSDYEIIISDYVLLPNGKKIVKVDNIDDNSNNVCRLSSEDVKLPLYVRNRKDGDKISIKGLNGSKKVKINVDSY